MWIHSNHLVGLLVGLLVPFLDLISNPVAEGLANYGSADVDYPLLWDPRDVRFVWQVVSDALLLANKRANMLKCEVLVLRNVQSLDLVVLEELLLHGDEIFEL